MLRIAAPPDKRDAPAPAQRAYLRELRARAARLFAAGQPALSACKWRRLLWQLQELAAVSTFNPDAPAEDLLPPGQLRLSAKLRDHLRALRDGGGGDGGDGHGDGGAGGDAGGEGAGGEGGGEGGDGEGAAAEQEALEELWRAGALGVAACALRLQQHGLAQAACRRVAELYPRCVDAHVRLSHALYAERHLDGALESLCCAVKLRPSHREARELHARISRLRAQLRGREASRRREAFKKMMG